MKVLIGDWILTMLFVGGLLAGGSDGGWFPWANLVGVGVLVLAAVGIAKMRTDDG